MEVTVRHGHSLSWEPSPSPSVFRKRLELLGPAESGVVTSIVKYMPNSTFHTHAHPDGEEIFVLEGTFTDHSGVYEKGMFILNPEGFEHGPSSEEGCILFVKLRQYPGKGRKQVRIDTRLPENWQSSSANGPQTCLLYDGSKDVAFEGQNSMQQPKERIELIRLSPNSEYVVPSKMIRTELFIVDGNHLELGLVAFQAECDLLETNSEPVVLMSGSWAKIRHQGLGIKLRNGGSCYATVYIKSD